MNLCTISLQALSKKDLSSSTKVYIDRRKAFGKKYKKHLTFVIVDCKKVIIETKAFEFEEFFNNVLEWLENKTVEIIIKYKEILFLVETDKIPHFFKENVQTRKKN